MKLSTYQSLQDLLKQIHDDISAAQISRYENKYLSKVGENSDELSRRIKEYLEQGVE